MAESKETKRRCFTMSSSANSWCSLIIKEGDVGSDNGAVSKSRRERITADNPHHRDARWLTKNIPTLRL
ncbi:hypothetical protein NC651_016447 [Populus alba x Populus x berolinensis]|nr:hypothetical protein NC651_016447 [Populus alba x Populus x berolinensis]